MIVGTAKPPPGQSPPPDGMIGTFATCTACIFGLAMIWLIFAVKEHITADFVLTNRRIILEGGMLRRHTLDMYLKHIDSLYVNRSLLGQLLGYGTVNVRSQASSPWRFHIAKAEEVRRYIQEQIARQV
ncbi:MAG: PH domain-containing protein [Anaerolineales bacterium]|nr:PH domain-containing protein [Anaerolineales bacterium]